MINTSYLNSRFCEFVFNKINQSGLTRSQVESIAETCREIGTNLTVVTIVTFLIDSKTNYINQLVALTIASVFWYTNFIIYYYLP
jgi:hypothetical protein